MRRQDKKANIKRANILAESVYLKKKNEGYDYAAAEREYFDKEELEDLEKAEKEKEDKEEGEQDAVKK